MLNYAHDILEGECRAAINTVGLEPSVGFLHETSDYQTKQSLVYDLQEPFRWLVDVSVLDAFESRMLDLPDFYFTGDDYRYRFEGETKQRFIDLIRERFNAGVDCRRRVLKWDTVIQQKVNELGQFLIGRSSALDFAEPAPRLERHNDREIRAKILSLTQSEAEGIGIQRSTLHYLRARAQSRKTIKVLSNISMTLQRFRK
jgi:CRISPR-associated protein Cas1